VAHKLRLNASGIERDCRTDISERCSLLPRAYDWVHARERGCASI